MFQYFKVLHFTVNKYNTCFTYLRLQSEAGRFQCEVSALRWVCTENVSFKYQFNSWETYNQMLDNVNCKQGGPLLNIKDIRGKIDEMYVPHWTCKGE